MISFRIAKHAVTREDVVEVLMDGEVCAALYAGEKSMLKIISAHITHVIYNDGRSDKPPIPDVTVIFAPAPYSIQAGKIVR